MDVYEAAGEHRIASLKCGHIFGESCIRRWIQCSAPPKTCPQCKTKASARDIRYIYASKIRALDNSREQELQLQIQQLIQEKSRLISDNSCNSMMITVQKAEIRKLKDELEMIRHSVAAETGRATAGIRTIKTGKMYFEKNLDFKENLQSRFLKYLTRNKKIIVAQKSSGTALFPGFGVKIIDFTTYRQEKFINTNNKPLNDFSFDSNESCFITASKEATCKMYNFTTNSSVQQFTPHTVPVWACAFDQERPYSLYVGAQNGTTYIYDIRQPGEVSKELVPLENHSPVKFTIPMKRTESFPNGGLFVVHVRGIYFYEMLLGEYASTTLNFNEPIMMASYDDRTEMLLITKSPSGQGVEFKQTRHILMRLVKEEGFPVLQEIYSFNGSHSALPSPNRPSQIKVPDGCIVVNYLEDSKMLQARTSSVGLLHEVSVSDPISDICPIYLDHNFYFGALSQSRCRLFKVNLGY